MAVTPSPMPAGGAAGRRSARPFVSVIVPLFHDPRLARCLQALAEQSYPADRFEVVVVDNGETPSGLTSLCALYPLARVTVHHEPTPGSYAARNLGVRSSRGEVLAFTDADCIPDRHWLTAAVERLNRDDGPDIVGGDVRLFPRDPGRLSAAELFECVWGFPQRTFVEDKHFAATANMVVHRHVFDAVGPFDGRLLSGGDMEWGQRAHRAGKSMAFCAEVFVRHPARRRLRELVLKYLRTCGGRRELRLANGEGHGPTLRKLVGRPFVGLVADNGLDSPWQRLRYAGVELVLSSVQLAELARLACGGRPRRR